MKKITREVEVPAETYEEVRYACEAEGCSFEAIDEEEYRAHYGTQHAVREAAVIDGTEFYRFDSQSDFEAWFDANNKAYQPYRNKNWYGAGWYGLKGYSEPCSRGCCTEYGSYVYPAFDFVEKWRDEIEELKKRIEAVKNLPGY